MPKRIVIQQEVTVPDTKLSMKLPVKYVGGAAGMRRPLRGSTVQEQSSGVCAAWQLAASNNTIKTGRNWNFIAVNPKSCLKCPSPAVRESMIDRFCVIIERFAFDVCHHLF